MQLADVFPRAQIVAAVPTAEFRDLVLIDFEGFADVEPNTAITFGFAAWDHALSEDAHSDLDLQMLAEAVNTGDPLLIRHVEAALGREALLDFHHVVAHRAGEDEPFAALSLARLYPNHIHIGDVLLLDPARPRQDSPWVDQKYESLRLFPVVLERLRQVAVELGVEKLTLTAANRPLRETFEGYGFQMAGTMGAKMVEEAGVDNSFPMELTLA